MFESWLASNEDWKKSTLLATLRSKNSSARRGIRKWMLFQEMCNRWGEKIALAMVESKEADEQRAEDEIRDFPEVPSMKQYLCLCEDSEEDLEEEAFETVFSTAFDSDSSSSEESAKKKKKKKKKKSKKAKKAKKESSPSPAKKKTESKGKSQSKGQGQHCPGAGVRIHCKNPIIIHPNTSKPLKRKPSETPNALNPKKPLIAQALRNPKRSKPYKPQTLRKPQLRREFLIRSQATESGFHEALECFIIYSSGCLIILP